MFIERLKKQTWQAIIWSGFILTLVVLINPITSIDLVLLGFYSLVVGHLLLREKLILVFLFIRPVIDRWRDVSITSYQGVDLTLTAGLSIMFLLWSGWMILTYKRFLKNAPLKILFPVLIVLMLVSSFYSISPFTSLIETIKIINLAGFFFLGFIFLQKKKISEKELITTIVASAVLPILFGISQLLFSTGITTFDVQGRIFGTLGHPNVFAFFILSLIILHTHYADITKDKFWDKKQKLKILTYILLFTLMIFTYTRVTLIGLGILIVLLGIYRYRKLLLVSVLVVSLFYTLFPPVDRFLIRTFNYSLKEVSVIARVTSRNEDADSISWRLSLLRESTPIIYKRPYFGYGYGTFQEVWRENRSLDHLFDDSDESHNDYLRITLELGFVGLAIYLLVILRLLSLAWFAIKKNEKTRQQYFHLFAWILIFAVVSLSDNMLRHTPVLWLTFAWWGMVLSEAPKEKRSPNLLNI